MGKGQDLKTQDGGADLRGHHQRRGPVLIVGSLASGGWAKDRTRRLRMGEQTNEAIISAVGLSLSWDPWRMADGKKTGPKDSGWGSGLRR